MMAGLLLLANEDEILGVSANVIVRPDAEWSLGAEGSVYELGLVGRYEPSEALRVRTVLSAARRRASSPKNSS